MTPPTALPSPSTTSSISSSSSSSSSSVLSSGLSSASSLRSLAASLGIPSIYLAVSLFVLLVLLVFQGWGLRLLSWCLGFLYPLYCSLRALSGTGPTSPPLIPRASAPRLWLIYWMVYGVLSFTERLSDSVLSWLPLYPPLKLLFLLWCFLPQWQGCAVLYDVLLQPFLQRHREGIEKGVEEVTEVLGVVGAHVVRNGRKASMQYIRRGEELLERITHSQHPPQPLNHT